MIEKFLNIWWGLLLVGWAGVTTMMFVLWLIQRRIRNAGVVDVGWSVGLAALAVFYAVAGGGDPIRRGVIGSLGGFWGLRLALHLLVDRIIGKPEDGRYQTLRAKWGARADLYFLPFFQFQALLDVILSVPFLVTSLNPEPGLSPLELAGVMLWIVSVAGETLADRQLVRFKLNPANKGKTCRLGLWRYSRHPNYFFEWLIWCAYALIALGAPYGWLSLACPAFMLFFLFRVTGIPATEAQALKSRGDDYREYQRTTSAFVPWFPKKERT